MNLSFFLGYLGGVWAVGYLLFHLLETLVFRKELTPSIVEMAGWTTAALFLLIHSIAMSNIPSALFFSATAIWGILGLVDFARSRFHE